MKNSDKAQQVAQEVIARAFVFLLGILIVLLAGTVTGPLGSAVGAMFLGLLVLWFIFVSFAHYFFRDPDPARARRPQSHRLAGTRQGGRD